MTNEKISKHVCTNKPCSLTIGIVKRGAVSTLCSREACVCCPTIIIRRTNKFKLAPTEEYPNFLSFSDNQNTTSTTIYRVRLGSGVFDPSTKCFSVEDNQPFLRSTSDLRRVSCIRRTSQTIDQQPGPVYLYAFHRGQ